MLQCLQALRILTEVRVYTRNLHIFGSYVGVRQQIQMRYTNEMTFARLPRTAQVNDKLNFTYDQEKWLATQWNKIVQSSINAIDCCDEIVTKKYRR